ncbi:interleukin-17 receptor C-like isoform X1 [Sinocyclocheilus anshuiensis]|uniref:Interleukin-17 receptor E-like n=1 Tax=Sinocyclocheilus anshuiensis TaxID=1608454 RepID=A0A671PF74_9TELE|nr:PREDICTED: interleukin-17 receptor C-like isoform X1 [Sinocyclocheilus anshuiensis]
MYSSSFVARVVLLFVSCEWSFSVRDSLKVRQEWSGAERGLPELRLWTLRWQDQLDVCVRVRLSVHPLQANESLTIELSDSETGDSYTLLMWERSSTLRWISSSGDPWLQPRKAKIQKHVTTVTSHQAFWIVRYDCFPAQPGSTVSVSVHSHSRVLISTSYVVEHTVPKASVTVDEHAKRFTVRMETDHSQVEISLCYNNSHAVCEGIYFSTTEAKVKTFNLSFPYLIPCVCVQLWFPGPDSRRNTQCPLKEKALPHGGDILSSSSVEVRGSVLEWKPRCPADQSDPSVSLCWRIPTQNSYCVPAPNATLHGTRRQYNVSAVDKHPQMCVKFSLNGSGQVFCPFESEGRSEWSVAVVPGSLHLHLRFSVAALFAAQLCARQGETCSSQGNVVSRRVDEGAAELSVPFPFLSSGLCVQVWRLDLRGRRIICPDFTHRRWGLITGTALALLAAVTFLVCITCYLVKKSTSVWRSAERRPVLLVCSSDHAAHNAAVCSLASGLQGELFMDVRLAQWASSLAQLGPVPWLYGQCQAVQKAGGLVLIAWSPDAHQAFLRQAKSDRVVGSEFSETGLYSAVEEEEQKSCDGEWMEKPVESSSITAPVFNAALSCLWTGLHSDGHARGFGLVCFQGLNNNNSSSTYIPKQLRCVPKYCLPKDLSSLIHDLGEPTRAHGSGRCWPRLLSKALSLFMWRQLAPRLKAGLTVPSVPKSSRKSVGGTKRKTRRQKKRRGKVVSACLSRKECSKKHSAPELLGAC